MQQNINATTTPALGKWNWGAFLLNWIWGIGNNVWISLLTFIPFFGMIWIFVLAIKGNQWAWEKGRWDNIDHFKRVQRNWAIAGFIVWIAIILFIFSILFGTFHALNNSWASKNSFIQVTNSYQVQQVLGTPIERSWLTQGNISVSSGGQGNAILQYSIQGPKSKATVYVQAKKYQGEWQILHLIVVTKSEKLVLINNSLLDVK